MPDTDTMFSRMYGSVSVADCMSPRLRTHEIHALHCHHSSNRILQLNRHCEQDIKHIFPLRVSYVLGQMSM